MKKNLLKLTLIFLMLSFSGANAKIALGNLVVFDVDFSDKYQSTNSKEEFRDLSANARLYSQLKFNDKLSIDSKLRFLRYDSVIDTSRRSSNLGGGGDRVFENQALFLENLFLKYKTNKYEVRAGKFNLNYGRAWRWDRGIWTSDVAENYRQLEKIGFRGNYNLGNIKTNGKYIFGVALFKNDSRNLDNSLITKRDSPSKASKAGDARLYESYKASLDVKFDFGEKEKLHYHAAHLNMGVNERSSNIDSNKLEDQKGYVFSMNYKKLINKALDVDWLVEFSRMKNINGDGDVSQNYFTANIITKLYDNWNLTLGHAHRFLKEQGENGLDEHQNEISFGYDFDKNSYFDKLTMQLGYRQIRLDQKTSLKQSDTFGILVRYYKFF